jgi:hypothetical protein
MQAADIVALQVTCIVGKRSPTVAVEVPVFCRMNNTWWCASWNSQESHEVVATKSGEGCVRTQGLMLGWLWWFAHCKCTLVHLYDSDSACLIKGMLRPCCHRSKQHSAQVKSRAACSASGQPCWACDMPAGTCRVIALLYGTYRRAVIQPVLVRQSITGSLVRGCRSGLCSCVGSMCSYVRCTQQSTLCNTDRNWTV